MIRKPFYRKFRQGFYETLSEKGASVLRYRGADNKEHYIAAGDSADVKPGGGMVETTWAELKALRDAGKLVAGQLYRITDYTTTTAQEMTQAAGHDFDVIVLALTSRSLSEDAWAAPRDGDGYFCDYEREDGELFTVEEVQVHAEGVGAELPPRREDGTMYWPDKLVLSWEEAISLGMITVEGHGSGEIDETPFLGLYREPYYRVIFGAQIDDDYFVDTLTPTPGVSRIYKGTYRVQQWVFKETDMVVATFEPGVSETHTETFTKRSALNRWRLRYCLDNDVNRFAWADSSTEEVFVEESIFITGDKDKYVRNPAGDVINLISGEKYYAWDGPTRTLYTTTLDIVEEVTRARDGSIGIVQTFYITTHEVVSEDTGVEVGRGVIYRLIDENNNDCPFDFKNIQFAIPMTDGAYNADSEKEVYMYTFSNPDDFSDGSDDFHDCRIISVAPDLNNIVFCGCGHNILVNGSNMFFSGDIYNVNIPVYSEGSVIDVSSQNIPVNGFNAPLGCDYINLNDMREEVYISLLNKCNGDIPKSVGVFMTKEGQIVEINGN